MTSTRKPADIPAPLTSTYFILSGLPDDAPRPIGLQDCEPEDFPLGVVAPFSHIREDSAQPCPPIGIPIPEARVWGSAHETGLVPEYSPRKPRIPKGPGPLPAAALQRAGIRSVVAAGEASASQALEYQARTRWIVLAVCFVGIAMGTRFVMNETSAPPPAAANQTPAAAFEDFSAGLNRWTGAAEGPKPWVLLDTKGASPRSLALFAPSKGMADFRLEFTTDVEKNGISWAIRATDPKNYQALQLWQKKAGTENQLWLTRYSVKAGKEGPHTQVQLQIAQPAQPIWLIRLEIVDESCTLWVENQIANAWSEAAVPDSSIGFFAGRNDQFVLKRVRITPE